MRWIQYYACYNLNPFKSKIIGDVLRIENSIFIFSLKQLELENWSIDH